MTLYLTIGCPECGKEHKVPLDAEGRYEGPLPCKSTTLVQVCVDPADWREVTRQAASDDASSGETVH